MVDSPKNQNLIGSFRELVLRSAGLFGDRDAFRVKSGKDSYDGISYNRLAGDVLNLAAAIEGRGLDGRHMAVLGENSYQWVVSYIGTVVSASVIVPIDKELTAREIQSIILQSEVKVLFCSDDYIDIANEIAGNIKIEVFTMTGTSSRYTLLAQLLEEGRAVREKNPAAGQLENDPGSLATIVFTSGTTGFSKGVMLSRANFMSNLDSADRLIHLGDSVLSVLPMHHTYEFTLGILYSIYQGLTICINDSIKYFAHNIKMFAPSDMLFVPLVAENLYSTLWQNVAKAGKEKKLRNAIKISNMLLAVGIDLRKTLFKDIHNALGGRLLSLFVGGAPFDPVVARGFHELGIRINIGYGITECSPLVAGNITDKPKYMGSCGPAIPGVDVRIVDANEAGEGEIEVRGKSVMLGYYKNPAATEEVFDGEWFRTGDIGRFDENGMLYITGRVKNLIVLKNGKNIYPEELEGMIAKIPYVREVVVMAHSNTAGEELSIQAEIFPDAELAARDDVTNVAAGIQIMINNLNAQLPYYKRITGIKYRDTEFPKTTSKKIKRYNT